VAVALQLVVPLGPPGVVLAVGAAVARVRPQLGAQPGDLALAVALGAARVPARTRSSYRRDVALGA
jgi:hypothetical protein